MKFAKTFLMVSLFYFVLRGEYTSYANGLPFNGTWNVQNQEMTIDSLKVTGNVVWVFRTGNVYKFDKKDGTYKQYNIDEIYNQNLFNSGYDVGDDGYVWLFTSAANGYDLSTQIKRCDGDSYLTIIEFNDLIYLKIACDNENGLWGGGISGHPRERLVRWDRTTGEQLPGGWFELIQKFYIAGSTAWLKSQIWPSFTGIPDSSWSNTGHNRIFYLLPRYDDTIPYTQGFTEIAGNDKYVTLFGKSSNGYGVVKCEGYDATWVDPENQLLGLKGGTWTQYTTADGLISNDIYALAIDQRGNYWAAGNGGVSWFDGTTWATLTTANSGLLDNTITGIGVDNDGVVWFGSQQGLVSFEYSETPYVEESEPKITLLCQPYPNPFNSSTTIEFVLPSSTFTSLVVYNLAGQKVREFIAESLSAGNHSVVWDGRDNSGNIVSSGMYIVQLKAGNYITSKMITFMK